MTKYQNFQTYKSMFQGLMVFAALLVFSSCKKESKQSLPTREWQLVWSDDFSEAAGTSVDATKWTFDIGRGDNGWGNQELQYYTTDAKNVAHDGNGNLVITARNESFGGAPFTSARIKTQGLFSQAYGRFEARLKTPTGPGLWPAFWMLGENITEVSWPKCGEIDIMEQRGQEPYINNGSIHGPGYSAGNSITKKFQLTDGRFDTDYHIYAIEWGVDFIDFFVDDFLYKRITPDKVPGEWVFNTPFYMIFNIAVGGNYVGFPTSGTPFPQSLTIDYVKVYKQQ